MHAHRYHGVIHVARIFLVGAVTIYRNTLYQYMGVCYGILTTSIILQYVTPYLL